MVIVVPGPASTELGLGVAELLGAKVVPVESKTFPDGESYIRLTGDVGEETAVIVQTTGPPQDIHLIQLFLMIDAVRDLGAKDVVAVVPYFAYARQDKRFLPGEAFSVKTVMNLLRDCGVNRVITVNAHNPWVLKAFQVPVDDLSAISLLAEHFKNQGLDGAFSLSLGKKALDMATQANRVLNGGFDYVGTQRDRITGNVTLEGRALPVKDRNVIIFDDIISSGGTMALAVKAMKDQGARRVYAACVHPLLAKGAEEKILGSRADGIVGTDCIPSPIIAQAL